MSSAQQFGNPAEGPQKDARYRRRKRTPKTSGLTAKLEPADSGRQGPARVSQQILRYRGGRIIRARPLRPTLRTHRGLFRYFDLATLIRSRDDRA